jgi:AcrR family transcriptional regulator
MSTPRIVMPFNAPLSSIQQRRIDQDALILDHARVLLLEHGYFGLTMARIAEATEIPKGTLYQRFACKEDIILSLAEACLRDRLVFVRRGAGYPGRPRERFAAIGEAVALYARLRPDHSRIIHNAGGPLREKASPERIQAIMDLEVRTGRLLRGIVDQAVRLGDLCLKPGDSVERITFGIMSLVDGAYGLTEIGIPQNALGMGMPVRELWLVYNVLADAYGWRPLYGDQDWEETMAEVRRVVFPEEAQELYGAGCWYGDHGKVPPPEPNASFG